MEAARAGAAWALLSASLVWMSDEKLVPHRSYWLKVGARTLGAQVSEIKHKIDVNTQEHLAAKRLELNEVAFCNLFLDQDLAFEPYAQNRELGGFILIDRQTNATVACGTIDFALRRAANVHWQAVDVDKVARASIKGQSPRCLWFTGLSGVAFILVSLWSSIRYKKREALETAA